MTVQFREFGMIAAQLCMCLLVEGQVQLYPLYSITVIVCFITLPLTINVECAIPDDTTHGCCIKQEPIINYIYSDAYTAAHTTHVLCQDPCNYNKVFAQRYSKLPPVYKASRIAYA